MKSNDEHLKESANTVGHSSSSSYASIPMEWTSYETDHFGSTWMDVDGWLEPKTSQEVDEN